jgi:uncharacterized damage-inducible protein DinB
MTQIPNLRRFISLRTETRFRWVSFVVDIRDLLAYNDVARRAFFKSFRKISWDDLIKNREASFNSIRNIFIHSINATNHWLDFLEGKPEHSYKEFDDYTSLEEIEAYMQHTEKRMNDYLKSLPPLGLGKEYHGQGKERNKRVTAEEILVHVFEEEVHHRGELIALYWQMGIKPPLVDFVDFVFSHRK